MALIVHKYGGTSMGSTDRIRNVAKRVTKWVRAGHQMVVVPSAMSKQYVERARSAGDPVTLVLRSGDGHMEHLDPQGVAWAAVRLWLEPWGP